MMKHYKIVLKIKEDFKMDFIKVAKWNFKRNSDTNYLSDDEKLFLLCTKRNFCGCLTSMSKELFIKYATIKGGSAIKEYKIHFGDIPDDWIHDLLLICLKNKINISSLRHKIDSISDESSRDLLNYWAGAVLYISNPTEEEIKSALDRDYALIVKIKNPEQWMLDYAAKVRENVKQKLSEESFFFTDEPYRDWINETSCEVNNDKINDMNLF